MALSFHQTLLSTTVGGESKTSPTSSRMHHSSDYEPQPARLTVAALEKQKTQTTDHDKACYVKSVVQAESTQRLERMTATELLVDKDIQCSIDRLDRSISMISNTPVTAEEIGKLYRPAGPSSMTPMQRFMLSSTTIDPFVVEHRHTSTSTGEIEGSIDGVESRRLAACTIAEEATTGSEKSQSAVTTRGSAMTSKLEL